MTGLTNGSSKADRYDDLKVAVEDSIYKLRVELYTVTAQRDTLRNELYINEQVNEATKPDRFDRFIFGFIAGTLVVIATGMVLNGTWD